MSRVGRYNFEKFSIFDIEEYLKQKGYQVKMKLGGDRHDELHIIGTDLHIDIPFIFSKNITLADIYFESYPPSENYEKSKKLFAELKRKFAVKKGELPKVIKDKDRMNVKNFS